MASHKSKGDTKSLRLKTVLQNDHGDRAVLADQMAVWFTASASGSVDLGFNSKSGQTNDFKIGIHSFPA